MDVYVTRAGDTWDSVAYLLYGDELRMTELMAANPGQAGVLVFGAGVELVVPVIETAAAAESVPPWKQ